MQQTNTLNNSQFTATERLDYLDAARGIGVILVVIVHHLLGIQYVTRLLYSFVLTPFFLISGYLYAKKNEWELSYQAIIVKYFKRFIYPYITFSIVNLVWNVLYYKVIFTSAVPDFGSINEMLLYTVSFYGYNALWYFPCIFLATLLFVAIRKLRYHRQIVFFFSIFLIVFYILFDGLLSGKGLISYVYCYLFRILMSMVFLYAGHLLFYVLQDMNKNKENIYLSLSIIIFGSMMLLYWFWPEHFPSVNLASHRLGNPYIYYPAAIVPAIIILLLCKKYLNSNKILIYLGRHSLIIVAMHMDIFAKIAWYIVAKLQINHGEIMKSMIVIVLEMAMAPVFVFIINKYFPFLLKFPQKKTNG